MKPMTDERIDVQQPLRHYLIETTTHPTTIVQSNLSTLYLLSKKRDGWMDGWIYNMDGYDIKRALMSALEWGNGNGKGQW